jgi:hypothetical protein
VAAADRGCPHHLDLDLDQAPTLQLGRLLQLPGGGCYPVIPSAPAWLPGQWAGLRVRHQGTPCWPAGHTTPLHLDLVAAGDGARVVRMKNRQHLHLGPQGADQGVGTVGGRRCDAAVRRHWSGMAADVGEQRVRSETLRLCSYLPCCPPWVTH